MAALNQTLINGTAILYGTCEVNDGYGLVVSCSVKETADAEVFLNCSGNARMVLLTNERFECDLEVEFDSAIGKPALGDSIAFPEVAVVGQVLESEIKWERKGLKMLSIKATHWKSIGDAPTITNLED